MDEVEVIAELDDTPYGRFGFLKRLVRNISSGGDVVYQVREYAPRPVIKRIDERPEQYVPARGVYVYEEHLREICLRLRPQLYDVRHVNDEKHYTEHELIEPDDDEDDDINNGSNDVSDSDNGCDCDYNVEDPIPDEDFENEIGFERFLPIASFPDYGSMYDETCLELNLVSWYGGNLIYDLRVFCPQVNSRGYIEMTPCIDRGVTLDDIEAELLCQGIEKLFPDLLKETSQYIEDNYEEKASIFRIYMTEEENALITAALDKYHNRILVSNMLKGERGSEIGGREGLEYSDLLTDINRKLIRGNRMSDYEYFLLKEVLREETAYHEDDPIYCSQLSGVADKIEGVLMKRNRLENYDVRMRNIRPIHMSVGEFQTAGHVLRLLYDELYDNKPKTDEQKRLGRVINGLVLGDIITRNSNRLSMSDAYKDRPGEHFLLDLIYAFEKQTK